MLVHIHGARLALKMVLVHEFVYGIGMRVSSRSCPLLSPLFLRVTLVELAELDACWLAQEVAQGDELVDRRTG